MSHNRLVFEGLDELRAALRQLPAELTVEASRIVEGAANGAAAEMKSGYPPGELRDGVTVTQFHQGLFSAGMILKNRSPLGFLWDNGSEARHYITVRGNRHATGKMWGRRPAPHTFVRAMSKARRLMWRQLKDLLTRRGLLVTGGE